MPGLTVFFSNRLEILSEQLSQIVREPSIPPFSSEIIVVQSIGIKRWLSMALAERNGICANCLFLFPNAFLREISSILIPDIIPASRFEPAAMTFSIMKLLPAYLSHPAFETLKAYLKDDQNQLKRYQLAARIADSFDQYLVFRPEMIFAWEAGRAEHWQAKLWRGLVSGEDQMHRARLREALLAKIQQKHDKIKNFFERISIFGISYLPEFHMQVFAEISRLIPVHLFLMNPCREYWADILSDPEAKRIKDRFTRVDFSDEMLHLERGNRLLASMGRMGRRFFSKINDVECQTVERFEEPGVKSLLSMIQSDILNLVDRPNGGQPGTFARSEIDGGQKSRDPEPYQDDRSIQIHSCHSPMREIEVLHDSLLAMFEEDPDLRPKDIIVMTPDIESYAPFIQAVFDAPPGSTPRIPFSIADRSIRKNSHVIDGFLSMLDLKGTRLGVTSVFSLLTCSAIREKFTLSESGIKKIEHWVKETNIRWGIDGENRSMFDLPRFDENTWAAGLKRLLLGFAMPGQNQHFFSDILPYDNIEGDDTKVLGNFVAFIDGLFSHLAELNKSFKLNDWSNILNEILEYFFAVNEQTLNEIQTIRRLLADMATHQTVSGYEEKIDFQVIQSYLVGCLEKQTVASAFISGGVTFCAMLPMRNIPSPVVCLIGMDNGAFPRHSRPPSFDFISKYPKPGDRSRRNDDKYLFLEAILSARKKLYISYVGQSIQDNSPIPPSVMVSELLDYLTAGIGLSPDRLITRHKLQAFSPSYFRGDARLFSFSEENFLAAVQTQSPPRLLPFFSTGLSDPPVEMKELKIETLCDFYAHPIRFLLQKRLGLFFEKEKSILNDRENFTLNSLETYLLGQALVQKRLSGSDIKHFLKVQQVTGYLPHGHVGDLFSSELMSDTGAFVETLHAFSTGKPCAPREIEVTVSDFRVSGILSDIHEDGRTDFRYADTKAKDLLRAWICHLVFCSTDPTPSRQISRLVCKDSTWEFNPVAESREILRQLLKLYWEGLSKPIPFFPESAHEYARQRFRKRKPKAVALIFARNRWSGGEFSHGESEDPYHELCFEEADPIDDRFCQISEAVFAPLLANCAKISLPRHE